MDGDLERDREIGHGLHLLLDHWESLWNLLFRNLKDQFVVNLHDHLGGKTKFLDPVLDANHCLLDDICGCPLQGGVDRHPLRGLSQKGVRRMDVWKITSPVEKCGHVTFQSYLL